MEKSRLDQSRQIELATMIGFLEEDERFLDTLIEEAGVGIDGDYEKFKVSMGRYWLNGARSYLESVVDTWFTREEMLDDEETESEPATVITAKNIKHSAQCTCSVCIPGTPGTSHTVSCMCATCANKKRLATTATTGSKAWTPAHKDADKIVAKIKEILADTPKDEHERIGFVGWLAASVTGALGGKSDPKVVLEKVLEVMSDTPSAV